MITKTSQSNKEQAISNLLDEICTSAVHIKQLVQIIHDQIQLDEDHQHQAALFVSVGVLAGRIGWVSDLIAQANDGRTFSSTEQWLLDWEVSSSENHTCQNQ